MVDTTATPAAPSWMSSTDAREMFGHPASRQVRKGSPTEALAWGENGQCQLGNGSCGGSPRGPGPVLLPEPATMARVAAGGQFGLALTTSGLVWAWGANDSGQLGNNGTTGSGRPAQVQMSLPEGDTVVDVTAGMAHCMALTSTGDVYMWGSNRDGALGIGDPDTKNSLTPVRLTIPWSKLGLPDDTTVTAISAGWWFSLAMTSTQQVLAWGWNWWGQLGNSASNLTNQFSPVLVDLPDQVKVTAIACGPSHSLAITTDQDVLAWGDNSNGQLGSAAGTSGHSVVPVTVWIPGGSVTEVAGGSGFSLARTAYGGVFAWGSQMLGNANLGSSLLAVPVWLPSGVTATGITAGGSQGLARTSTGQVFSWVFGEPAEVRLGGYACDISGNVYVRLALVSPEPTLAWGANDSGQLGNNDSTHQDQDQPVGVHVDNDDMVYTHIAAGDSHGLAITGTGQLLAWGSNKYGQLGTGPNQPGHSDTPVPVPLPHDAVPVALAAGAGHSLALTVTGDLYVWGRNNDGQLGLGHDAITDSQPTPVKLPLDWLPSDSSIVAIAANNLHSLVLLSNGGVFAFGNNDHGQLGVNDQQPRYAPVPMKQPPGGVSAIAAGGNFSLILRHGIAYGCGANDDGQLGTGDNTQLLYPSATKPVFVPEDVIGIAAVAAGSSHGLAITTDGGVIAFGDNGKGQLGYGQPGGTHKIPGHIDTSALNLPEGTTITAFAAGCDHSLAVTSQGWVLAWGDNDHGQLGNGSATPQRRPVRVNQPSNTTASAVAAGKHYSLCR